MQSLVDTAVLVGNLSLTSLHQQNFMKYRDIAYLCHFTTLLKKCLEPSASLSSPLGRGVVLRTVLVPRKGKRWRATELTTGKVCSDLVVP